MGLGQARGSIVIDIASVEDANRRVAQLSKAMTQSLDAIGLGTGILLAKQLAQITYELASTAAQANLTRESFNSLAASAGQNADEMLSAMRKASRGMIADSDLVLSANKAMLLGVADTGEKLGKLLDVARVRGQAMGLTLTKAFDDVITGLARSSIEILDNLGIKGTREALDAYAASAGTTADKLSDAQKQVILFNAVMASTQPLIDASAGATDNASTKFQQFEANLKNSKDQLGNFLLAAGATDSLDKISDGLEENIVQLQRLESWLSKLKDAFTDFAIADIGADNLKVFEDRVNAVSNAMAQLGYTLGIRGEGSRFNSSGVMSRGSIGGSIGGSTQPTGGSTGPEPVPAAVYDPKPLLDAQRDYYNNVADIDRNAHSDMQDATDQYGRQRAKTISSYEQSIARDAEDFSRSRLQAEQEFAESLAEVRNDAAARELRAAEDLARTIDNARRDSSERIADMEEDYQRDIADTRQDSTEKLAESEKDRDASIVEKREQSLERLADLESDYARNRERALQDHNLRRDELASRGDARGLFEEDRRFELENQRTKEAHDEQLTDEQAKLQEAIDQLNRAHAERVADEKRALDKSLSQSKESHDRQVDDEKKALDKRVSQANDAYLRQLEEARTNDAQRILDMQESFEDQQEQEDIERGIRLDRQAADHAAQLTEMDTAQGERIAQIKRQAGEQRTQLDTEFKADLADLGLKNDAWIAEQKRITDAAIEEFEKWSEGVNKWLTGAGVPIGPQTGPGTNPSFDKRREQLTAEYESLRQQSAQLTIGSPEHSALLGRMMELEQELAKLNGGAAMASGGAMAAMSGAQYVMPQTATATSAATGTGGGRGLGSLTIENLNIIGAANDSPQEWDRRIRGSLLGVLREYNNGGGA